MRVGRYINEVCGLLDVTVLHDITIENDVVTGCVALGQEGEINAGIRFAVVTKWFANEQELDEFCELNINRFRIAAQQQTAVDATEWR